jgi:hypothetical protein
MCSRGPWTPCPPFTIQPVYRLKNTCWSNGVKLQVVTDLSNPAFPTVDIAARKNGTACYTMSGTGTPGFTGSLSYQVVDATGRTLGVYTIDPATGEQTIVCLVGPTVVIPATCRAISTSTGTESGCSTGVCTGE